jgi:23S rRNA (guanosine2251-2'-O)-methyltransferase
MGRRPERGARFDSPRPEGSRFDGPRGGGSRFEGSRPEGSRIDGRRYGASRPEGSRAYGGRPAGSRSPGGRFEGRSRDGLRPGRTLPTRPVFRSVPEGPAADGSLQGVHRDEPQASDLIWGRHAALAALESGRPVHRIWCTPEMRFSPKFLQLLREAKASGVLVEEVTWARLGQLTDGAVHQGIVLQAAAADTLDLASLIDGCRAIGEPPLLMALDGITDPHNLGAIARSAEALGAHGLVLPQRRSAGLTGSVAKVAAGALEHLPVARVVNLNRALDSLKQEGYRVVGLAAEGSVSLEQVDLDGPLVIVTGSEGDGLSMLTRKHCDQLVSIPLRGATPSLNASVATALLLYEVARRGWMKGLRGGDPAPRIVRPQLPTPQPASAEPEAAALHPAEEQPIHDQTVIDQTAEELIAQEPYLEPHAGEPHAVAIQQPAADLQPALNIAPVDGAAAEPRIGTEQEEPAHPSSAAAPPPSAASPVPAPEPAVSNPRSPVIELGLATSPDPTFLGDVQL